MSAAQTPESAPFSLTLAMEHGGRAMTRDGRLVTDLLLGVDGMLRGSLAGVYRVWTSSGFTDDLALDHNPRDLRNLTPEEAKEQGVGKQEVMGMSVKDARDVIGRAINETVPARPEIDTSRPVEWEDAAGSGPKYVGSVPNDDFPLVYHRGVGDDLIRYSATGMPYRPGWAPIRNIPSEPKRIKGWVVVCLCDGRRLLSEIFETEGAARAVALSWRPASVAILEIDLPDGDGL